MQGKVNWGRVLLSGASLAALGSGVAYAQDAEVTDEIIVTATGRAAAIQDVPLAVTAVSGEAIENAGVRDIRDLQQLAPSYRFFTGQSNTASTNAIIRGIGTGTDNPGFEAAVAVFIDGVYRSRTGTALASLPEVERIEVLRGPQGTLFGRNTSAGALSIVTAGPEFEPSVWIEGSAGDLDLTEAKFGFTTPVVQDTLAIRFDASALARDGYIEDLRSGASLNARDRWSARLQGLWDISPDASLRVIVDGGNVDEDCCYAVTRQRNDSGLAINAFLAGFAGVPGTPGAVGILPGNISAGDPTSFLPAALGDYKARQSSITPGREPSEAIQEWGASAQLDWDIGELRFTSITSFRDWDTQRNQDIDFTDLDRAYREGLEIRFETVTQEFRLQGEAGRIDWLVGAYVGSEELTQTDRIRVGVHAANYLDILAAGQDLSALIPDLDGPGPLTAGFDFNGPAVAGSGLQVYNSLAVFDPDGPGPAPKIAPPVSFLQIAFGALAATQDLAAPGGAIIAGNLAAGAAPGGLADDLALTDPVDGDGQQKDFWQQQTDNYALFTHNEINITDDLVWTIGARFNSEEKDYVADLNAVAPSCGALQTNALSAATVLAWTPNPLLPASQQQALADLASGMLTFFTLACNPVLNTIANGAHAHSRSEQEWTGTTSLAYHLSPDLMFYGAYSRGYKSGGYNLDRSGFGSLVPFSVTAPADDEPEFDPEFTNSYEIGVKSTLAGGDATFNVTYFYEQIEDFQVNAFSGFNFITLNAKELISQGVEVEGSARMTDHLTLAGGVTWNDAYYNGDEVSPVTGDVLIPDGTQLSYASEWVATAAITYRQPITADLEALFYLDGRYNSEAPTATLARSPLKDNDAYTLVNARVGVGSPEGRWALELWGRNLTDETYFIGSFNVPEQDNIAVYPNEPLTWGVSLRARY